MLERVYCDFSLLFRSIAYIVVYKYKRSDPKLQKHSLKNDFGMFLLSSLLFTQK